VNKFVSPIKFTPDLWAHQFGASDFIVKLHHPCTHCSQEYPNCSIQGDNDWYGKKMVRALDGSFTEAATRCGVNIVSGNYQNPDDMKVPPILLIFYFNQVSLFLPLLSFPHISLSPLLPSHLSPLTVALRLELGPAGTPCPGLPRHAALGPLGLPAVCYPAARCLPRPSRLVAWPRVALRWRQRVVSPRVRAGSAVGPAGKRSAA
jgi:hypothetical protein